MKIAPDIAIEWVEDEAVALNPESGELHYLNTSAALVLALIEEHGYEQALAKLRSDHSLTEESEEAMNSLMQEMVEKGLLVDD